MILIEFRPIIPFSKIIIYFLIMLVIIVINRKHFITRIFMLLLIVIITQRPVIKDYNNKLYQNLDILFVIDTSVSMNAVSISGTTRIDSVKADCKKIMEKFRGANYAIITFDNYAMVKTPFTSDSTIVYDIIDNLKVIDPNYAVGSSLLLPLENMSVLLKSSNSREKNHTLTFYMSDGEMNVKKNQISDLNKYSELKELINNGAILGYGSLDGEYIIVKNSIDNSKVTDEKGYLIDKTKTSYEKAVSKLNEYNLLLLKSNLGLDYYRMDSKKGLEKKIKEIEKKVNANIGDTIIYDKELYYYFSLIVLIFFGYELIYYRRTEQ